MFWSKDTFLNKSNEDFRVYSQILVWPCLDWKHTPLFFIWRWVVLSCISRLLSELHLFSDAGEDDGLPEVSGSGRDISGEREGETPAGSPPGTSERDGVGNEPLAQANSDWSEQLKNMQPHEAAMYQVSLSQLSSPPAAFERYQTTSSTFLPHIDRILYCWSPVLQKKCPVQVSEEPIGSLQLLVSAQFLTGCYWDTVG